MDVLVARPGYPVRTLHRERSGNMTALVACPGCSLRSSGRRPSGNNVRASCGKPYILNTPNLVSLIGAFKVAEIANPNTIRVSAGSITPSSHNRAEA